MIEQPNSHLLLAQKIHHESGHDLPWSPSQKAFVAPNRSVSTSGFFRGLLVEVSSRARCVRTHKPVPMRVSGDVVDSVKAAIDEADVF
jgi:hypothetical protein